LFFVQAVMLLLLFCYSFFLSKDLSMPKVAAYEVIPSKDSDMKGIRVADP
jgi:hypothetical protein